MPDRRYGIQEIGTIAWWGDKNEAAFLNFWESRMANVKQGRGPALDGGRHSLSVRDVLRRLDVGDEEDKPKKKKTKKKRRSPSTSSAS